MIATTKARTDPEDVREIPLAPIAFWFRINESRRIAKFLSVGASGMVLGALLIARLVTRAASISVLTSHSPTRVPMTWPPPAPDPETWVPALLGFTFLVGGGLFAILGLRRVLEEERYLALRVDGLLFVDGSTRRFVSWDDVADVRYEAPGNAIVFVRESASDWVLDCRFAGASNSEIVKKALEVRRRSLLGMYRHGSRKH
jgi:hypothetical protein